MSKLKDKFNQSAIIVKWKVDQQFRVNSSQTKERQIMGEIEGLKTSLANKAFQLYENKGLSEDSLVEICSRIEQLQNEFQAQQQQTTQIKAEEPPVLSYFDQSSSSSSETIESTHSGLICPNCKRAIPVRFCPDCGHEGVSAD